MGQVWKQACEGMITTQKYSKHNLDNYVYVGYVYDQKRTQKCFKTDLDKYV